MGLTWYHGECPICHRHFLYTSRHRTKTCGRQACAQKARNDKRRRTLAQPRRPVRHKPVAEEFLSARGPSYHSCGNPLIFGTNGFGYTTQYCGACQIERTIPRGKALGI